MSALIKSFAPSQLRQLAERRLRRDVRRAGRCRNDPIGHRPFFGAGPSDDCRQIAALAEVFRHGREPFDRPALRGPARSRIDHGESAREPAVANEPADRRVVFRMTRQVEPHRRPANPQRFEQLQIAIDDVHRRRLHAPRVEHAAQLAPLGPIKSNSHAGP